MQLPKIIVEVRDGRVTNIVTNDNMLVKVVDENVIYDAPFRQVSADPEFEVVNSIVDNRIKQRFYQQEGP